MKKTSIFALALCMFASACSDSVVSVTDGETDGCNVSLKLSMQDWGNQSNGTRASGELSYPISLFYVAKGQTNVKHVATILNGEANFSFSVPNGDYDIYASLGLQKNLIPTNINDVVEIPKNKDFSAASASFSVNNGNCDLVELVANHKMAWLDMTITDVPSSIEEINIYVKGLYAEYVFSSGWQEPSAAVKEKYTQVAVSKAGSDYKANEIIFPCCNKSEVEFIAEVSTASGYTKLLKGIVDKPLSEGKHMIISTSLSSLNVIEENITMSEWIEISANGTITDSADLNIGDQYFGQAATVVKKSDESIFVLPHKPMTVSLSDVKTWSDFKSVAYNESPEINVDRWSLVNVASAYEIGANIQNVGWDNFVATIEASGNSIDRDAGNLIIAYDQGKKEFWRFDLNNISVVRVTDESGEFLLYPIGVINLLP